MNNYDATYSTRCLNCGCDITSIPPGVHLPYRLRRLFNYFLNNPQGVSLQHIYDLLYGENFRNIKSAQVNLQHLKAFLDPTQYRINYNRKEKVYIMIKLD